MRLQVMISMSSESGIASFLRQMRELRGLGVNQLALKSGVSNAEISRIENGKRKRPHPDTLTKLATALNVPVEEFYRRLGYLGYEMPSTSQMPLSRIMERAGSLARENGIDIGVLAESTGEALARLQAMSDDDFELKTVQQLAYYLNTTMHYLLGRIDDPAPLPGVQVAHHDPAKGVEPGDPMPPETQLIAERAVLAAMKEWGWDNEKT